MEKEQRIIQINVQYKNDREAKQKLIRFLVQYLLENGLKKDDAGEE